MEANPQGATTVDGAVDRLSAMFNPEPEQSAPPESAPVEAPDVPNDTEVEAATVETPDGDTEAEVERYKVKVGDDELDVTLDEMRKGYMMESDYRKKTTEVSERRKALEAKEADIDSRLTEAESLVRFELDNLESPQMLEMKQTDPDGYLREFDRVQKKVEQFNKHKQQRTSELNQKQQEVVKKEIELLEAAIPEWLDPEVKAKEGTLVMSYLEQQGYSREQLATLTDHKAFVTARKAMLFDQLGAKDLDAKKVKTPPKSQQPGTSRSSETNQSRTTQDLKKKLGATGKQKDAANLIRQMMR